jgi:glycosyltransferase involved in cell wall biosynthesis
MNSSLVSICIPVYNSEKYIGEAIKSVLNQTYKNFELLIVDNKSTDNSVSIIKTFKDKRITLFQNDKNIGMFPNHNKALELAKGDYIKFLMSDDLLPSNCLTNLVKVFENNPNVVLITGIREKINEKGETISYDIPYKKEGTYKGKNIIVKSFRESCWYIGLPSAVAFRKSSINKIGHFLEQTQSKEFFYGWSVDWEYWLRILTTGNFYFIKKTFCKYRIHDLQGTSQINRNFLGRLKHSILLRKQIYQQLNKYLEKSDLDYSILQTIWATLQDAKNDEKQTAVIIKYIKEIGLYENAMRFCKKRNRRRKISKVKQTIKKIIGYEKKYPRN